MLGITTTTALSIVDSSVLKKSPSSVPTCITLDQPTSSTWSTDNSCLYICSANSIYRYDTSSNSLDDIYSSTEIGAITNIQAKEKGTVVFSAGDEVHLLECDPSPKVTQTYNSHKATVLALSLSNDNTLLASISADAAHVHNLSLGSHVVLRGLPLNGQSITTCSFHPHSRTRLLLGVGKLFIVYDTTRPSGPLKTIALNEASSGDILAIACSPFSKTLVAAATSSGHVGLIDLDKEKGLFRTLAFKVPLTSIGFSPEGAAIYLGTENGKLLIADLRMLDKPPKVIVVNNSENRIETLSVQKKLKGTIEPVIKPGKATATASVGRRPLALTEEAKGAPSPLRARSTKTGPGASPATRRVPSSLKKTVNSPGTPRTGVEKRKVLSPAKDPLGNSQSAGNISVEFETLGTLKGAKTKLTPTKSPILVTRIPASPQSASTSSARERRVSSTMTISSGAPRSTKTVPSALSRTRKTSTTTPPVEPVNKTKVTASKKPESTLQAYPATRPRTASSASRAGTDSISTGSARTSSSRTRTSRSRSSPAPPLPPLPTVTVDMQSRTPSPEFPEVNPITPVSAQKTARKGLSVLGLGTPEVDAWIKAGDINERRERIGKTVGFKDDQKEGGGNIEDTVDEYDSDNSSREKDLSIQVSPRRPTASAESWVPSPGRPSSLSGGAAHDLLRTIVRDVMSDFQQESRAEMVGLHLDLVRLGRGWKKELRAMMDEYVGDLRELREENQRLRDENVRLRSGY